MTHRSGIPRIVTSSGARPLEPVVLTETVLSEGWLQDLLHRFSDLLPVDEIGAAWGPLVSLAREVPVSAGYIDNLYVSPTGELTVVEAKLWRNPEARRKVVGQVLDYAASMASMTYEDLEAAVSAGEGDCESIWGQVLKSHPSLEPDAEAAFHDTVSRNLRAGSFLLLVVGDGIREDLEGLAGLIGTHPDMSFHLELVELQPYRMGDPDADGHVDYLVVPSLVGRTDEITRAVVEVSVSSDGDVKVNVAAVAEAAASSAGNRGRSPYGSAEDFIDVVASRASADQAEGVARLIAWWEQRGGTLRFNKRSVAFVLSYRHNAGKSVGALTLYVNSKAELNVGSLVEWWEIADETTALKQVVTAGFPESAKWPSRFVDLSGSVDWELLTGYLEWVVDVVGAANEGDGPDS